jgi:hypothetical protein
MYALMFLRHIICCNERLIQDSNKKMAFYPLLKGHASSNNPNHHVDRFLSVS